MENQSNMHRACIVVHIDRRDNRGITHPGYYCPTLEPGTVSLIDRYIIREFGPFFGIALSVTTFVLVLNKLFRLADLV